MTLPTVNRAHDYIVHASSIHGTRYPSTVRAASDPVIAHKGICFHAKKIQFRSCCPSFHPLGFRIFEKDPDRRSQRFIGSGYINTSSEMMESGEAYSLLVKAPSTDQDVS